LRTDGDACAALKVPPSTGAAAAAGSIGNAVADATGYRPVRLPIRATDVHAHLRRAAG
jgi:CO/xanthine dehydrogenase Mo-binding subunit